MKGISVPRFSELPLANIKPSGTNPRKRFDGASLAQMAETIKEVGVVAPVLVRKASKGEYELIFGERRYRAAVLAGLEKIPAVVRDVDDLAAIEFQVIENDQREGLTAIERAEGYRALMDRGYTVNKIAERVGRSVATVYGTLKLLELPAAVRFAVDEGMLEATTACAIARIPAPELRARACKEILGDGEPMTAREAAAHIRRNFMVELKLAPFALDDGSLGASACTTCPKQAKNNREEFPDGRGDVCTDPGCYQRKCAVLEMRKTPPTAAAVPCDSPATGAAGGVTGAGVTAAGPTEPAGAETPIGSGKAIPFDPAKVNRIWGCLDSITNLHRGHPRAMELNAALDLYRTSFRMEGKP